MRNNRGRTGPEDITVAGSVLLDKIKDLIAEGNVRRLLVRRPGGKVLIDVPLTAGVGVAGVLTLIAPMLAAIGAMAALFSQFRLEIERNDEPYVERPYVDRRDRDR